MRAGVFLAVLLVVLAAAPPARAEVRLDLGFEVGWMVWGGAVRRGEPSNPTGGIVFAPSGRLSLSVPGTAWVAAQYTLSPMVLAPFSPQTGLVAANDLGLELHAPDGSIGAALAGTAAPLYATFCNPEWCYPEALVAWGGVARAFARVHRDDEKKRAVRFEAAIRVLYAQPTAWTWPGLPPELRRVVPTSTMFTAGGSWSW